MKYIIFSNFNSLKKVKKMMIIYILIIIMFCLFELQMKQYIEISDIKLKALGMIFSMDFLELLIYALNFSFYIFMIGSLFLSDFESGGQNIFSRIKKKKYIIYKMISIFSIVFLCKLFCHLVVSIVCGLKLDFLVMVIDFNHTLCMGLIMIILFVLNNSKISTLVIYFLLFVFIAFIDFDLLSPINIPFSILLFVNILLIVINIYISKFLFKIYERND